MHHWNNSPPVDMSVHSDTVFLFRANQSFLLLISVICSEETQRIPMLGLLFDPIWVRTQGQTHERQSRLLLHHQCDLLYMYWCFRLLNNISYLMRIHGPFYFSRYVHEVVIFYLWEHVVSMEWNWVCAEFLYWLMWIDSKA